MLFTDDYLKKGFHTLKHHKWTRLQYNVQMKVRRLPPSICQELTEVIFTWHSFSMFTPNESGFWFPACFTLCLCGRVAAASPVSLQTSTDAQWVSGAAHLYAPLYILTFVIIRQTKSDLLTSFNPLKNSITHTHTHTHTLTYVPGAEQFCCMMQYNDTILQPQQIL